MPGNGSSIHITTTHARVFSAEGITGYAGGNGLRRWPVTSVHVIDDKAVFPMTVGRSIDEFLRRLMALQDGGRLAAGRQGCRAATGHDPGSINAGYECTDG